MYLNCHTFHSLRYGTISIEDLVKQAVNSNVKTLALTDINTITGIYDFTKLCHQKNIKPIVGVEIRSENELYYVTLAKNAAGIAEINRILTAHNCDGEILPKNKPDFKEVFVIYPLENVPETLLENEFIGVKAEQLNLIFNSMWKRLVHKMVILQPVTFKTKQEFNLHKILRAIDLNTLISKLNENDYCQNNEILKTENDVFSVFKNYPQIIKNTEFILENCSFDYEFGVPRNKKHFTESKDEDEKLLRKLAYEGFKIKYPAQEENAILRLEKELKVIDQLNFSGYFLITWDIVRYSNSQGFMHVGRGSGANSIVSFCLGITDICPIELDLYFERFLNLNRKSPPDFDIDWSWQNRDAILDYIFKKYGKEHVAFCGTNVEFKYRSIFRELGKVFGLPKEELDALATRPQSDHEENSVVKLVHKYGKLLEKFPNQRSMHSCGILISEEPLTNFTALEMPPKGFPIVQFDMNVAEDIGFEKFDILSQRGLGSIKDAKDLILKNQNILVDIKDTSISKNEKICNEFLAKGKTIGCFYIESPAMRGLLRRLKCENYITLVAASSIIRPGVAKSGMMREYIFRHNNPDKFEYFHPVFEENLKETYGIMVYQEDVLKIAQYFGGLTLGDGDILRRAMSGKERSINKLNEVKEKFFNSCKLKGHSVQMTTEAFRQIESFAGYSFCKAHSASYAVESYQSLYLKVYYPLEFMVSVINNQGGFYRTEVYVHEAKMSGGKINNPCVNKSDFKTTVYGEDIFLGLMHIEKIEGRIAQFIPEEREINGDYLSLENFIKRVPLGIESLQILIFIGAFRFTGKQKNELLIESRFILSTYKPDCKMLSLLEEPAQEYQLPVLKRNFFEDAFDEIEILGFTVSCTPFDLLQTKFRGNVMAKDLIKFHKREVKMMAYLISRKHVPTTKGTMFFGTWIDFEGNYFDTAHFPDNLHQYPFQGGGCYLLLGLVEVDFHFPTITVLKMAKMPFIADPRYINGDKKSLETQNKLKEDVSMTTRKPYPKEHEIGLPRQKMK